MIDCPITVDDIKLAIHIYGPSNAMRKGKRTSKRSSCIRFDFLYVNGIMFLHSISRKFKFRTVEVFYGRRKIKAVDTLTSINKVIDIYRVRNLNVIQIDVDMEFKSLENELLPI